MIQFDRWIRFDKKFYKFVIIKSRWQVEHTCSTQRRWCCHVKACSAIDDFLRGSSFWCNAQLVFHYWSIIIEKRWYQVKRERCHDNKHRVRRDSFQEIFKKTADGMNNDWWEAWRGERSKWMLRAKSECYAKEWGVARRFKNVGE